MGGPRPRRASPARRRNGTVSCTRRTRCSHTPFSFLQGDPSRWAQRRRLCHGWPRLSNRTPVATLPPGSSATPSPQGFALSACPLQRQASRPAESKDLSALAWKSQRWTRLRPAPPVSLAPSTACSTLLRSTLACIQHHPFHPAALHARLHRAPPVPPCCLHPAQPVSRRCRTAQNCAHRQIHGTIRALVATRKTPAGRKSPWT
jgi:hypothetical protein